MTLNAPTPPDRPLTMASRLGPGSGPLLNVPPAVVLLLIIVATASLALFLMPEAASRRSEFALALWPRRFIAGLDELSFSMTIAPLVTHLFIHADLAHLGMNCLWLLVFGAPTARRLGCADLGAPQGLRRAGVFIAFFLFCGVIAALACVVIFARDSGYFLGASAGVSGLLGAVVRFAFRPREDIYEDPYGFSSLLSPPLWIASAAIIGLNVFFGVIGPGLGLSRPNVLWEAHIAGYLAGLLAFPAFVAFAGMSRPPSLVA